MISIRLNVMHSFSFSMNALYALVGPKTMSNMIYTRQAPTNSLFKSLKSTKRLPDYKEVASIHIFEHSWRYECHF
jgi:hypothetical protein